MAKLSITEEAVLWNEAARRLIMVNSKSAVSTELVDRLQSQLPIKQANETFSEYIRRASLQSKQQNKIVDITPKQFTPLCQFERLAADTSGAEIALPDCDIESQDGRFRLKVSLGNNKVRIIIQALSFAADEFAGCSIAIANPADNKQPIAILELDQDGDGDCLIEDSNEVRRALLNPVLLLAKE